MNKETNSRFEIRLPLLLAATLALGMLIGQKLPRFDSPIRFMAGSFSTGSVSGTIDEVLRYIDAKYVDTVDIRQLKSKAISQMLAHLDPHSVYIPPEEFQQVEEDMSGNFEGIGIEFLVVQDTIQVVTPITGGPSAAAGILAGDKIITIQDSTVAGVQIDHPTIFKKLRGPKGSNVRIGILRSGNPALQHFTITRDVIPVNSVEIAYMLDAKTAYVRISRFTARTFEEFVSALQPLSENPGFENLVLDLRGNPGGYLDEAVDILSQLFPEGKLLVYTKGRTEDRYDYKSNGRARFAINNIAVLTDEGSASASEIIAGAVQDHDRGWVIGRRSFGKGLVQVQYPLGDGGALRLTVSRYYTPSGRCIQRDYSNADDYKKEADRRFENGELSDPHQIKVTDSTQYFTGMGRVVYGGGGVTPDVFIPLDTSYVNPYFFSVRQMIPVFTARWYDQEKISRLPQTLEPFLTRYEPSDAELSALIQFAEAEGTPFDESAYRQCKNELKLQLKARIARKLFQEEGFYRVLNDDDPAILKARKILLSGEPVAGK